MLIKLFLFFLSLLVFFSFGSPHYPKNWLLPPMLPYTVLPPKCWFCNFHAVFGHFCQTPPHKLTPFGKPCIIYCCIIYCCIIYLCIICFWFCFGFIDCSWCTKSEVKVNIYLLFFLNQLLFCNWINRCILFCQQCCCL